LFSLDGIDVKPRPSRTTQSPNVEAPEPANDPAYDGHVQAGDDVLAIAFERMPAALAIVHADGLVLRANVAFAAMLGYSAEEMRGRNIVDLSHADDLPASRASIERLWRSESVSYRLTKRYIHKDGRIVWVEAHVSWLRDRHDSRLLLHVTDVTAEKESRDALAKSELQLRQMVAAVDQIFWMYSLDPFRPTYASAAGDRIYGFDPPDDHDKASEVHAERMLAAVHPDDLPIFMELMGDLSTTAREREYRVVRADGEIRWVRVRAFLVLDPKGHPHSLAGMTEDITTRKQAELELERYHRLERLIAQFSAEFVHLSAESIDDAFLTALTAVGEAADAAVVGIWLFDETGSTLRLRWHWHKPGFPAAPLSAFELASGGIPTEFDRGVTLDRAVSELPDEWAAARSAFAADGLRSSLAAPLMAGGKLLGILSLGSPEERIWPTEMSSLMAIAAGMFANVIERSRADEAIRAHRDQLAHTLRLKTMGQLASGIAHDLNQPLSAILSYARGCARRIASGSAELEEIRGALEKIGDQAIRAANVIRLLRAMVKGESSRQRHDLNVLIDETLRLMQPDLTLAGIYITAETADHPTVQVDAIQIEQVLLNLIRNACDALADVAPDNKEIRIIAARRGSSHLEVSILDRGPGVDLKQAGRIFDDFYTTKPDGVGLGLPISRSIIEAHGGRLWLDTSVVQGACFRFTLPVASAD